MNDDKVTIQHPKYATLQEKREAFHAIKGGTDTVQKAGRKYLPMFQAEPKEDYDVRLKLSTIDGIVRGGVESLTGAVFEGEIDVSKVNPSIVPLLENIDNQGNHFDVFVRDSFEAAFDGSSVILVDMPVETPESRDLQAKYGAEADKMLNKRPYWTMYPAANVTNWRYQYNHLTGTKDLVLLVVKVVSTEPDGVFKMKEVTRYRVWILEGQRVIWQTWIAKNDKEAELENQGVVQGVTAIPASILGCLEDEPRLMVETRLEIKAYQKESSYDVIEYMAIPALMIKGRSGDAVGQPIPMGANTVIDVPVEGDAAYIQIDAAGHDTLKGTIKEIKNTIASRLDYIAQQPMPQFSDDKTATEVVTEDEGKQARLRVWTEQCKDAVELALGFTAEFMGMGRDKGGEITFNTKWAIAEQKAMEREQMNAEREKAEIGAIAKKGA